MLNVSMFISSFIQIPKWKKKTKRKKWMNNQTRRKWEKRKKIILNDQLYTLL